MLGHDSQKEMQMGWLSRGLQCKHKVAKTIGNNFLYKKNHC